MDGVKVRATVSREGIEDLNSFIGLPFLTPKRERLGEIIAVYPKEGPYCEIAISIDPGKIQNPYVMAIFFPDDHIPRGSDG
jgi:hypothetical protein